MTSKSPAAGRVFRLLTLGAFAAGLAYLLIGEHRVHLLGWAPCSASAPLAQIWGCG